MLRAARSFVVVLPWLLGLPACDALKPKTDAGPAASASAAAALTASATASAAPPASAAMPKATVTAPPATPMPGNPDLGQLLGTKADGWNPKVFAGLKEGMTPAQAAKVFKYADAYDPNGITDIPVGNVKGVQRYRLSYLDGKLKFVEIWFSATTPAFRATLEQACTARWGLKPTKAGESSMWIGPDFRSISVSAIIDLTAKGIQITVAL
jgi:hypothetical protein